MTLKEILNLQKKRMGAHTGYTSEDELLVSTFDEFESNPAFQIVTVNKKDLRGVHFLRKQTRFGDIEVYIITRPKDSLNVGDYLLDRNNQIWFCYLVEEFPIRKHHMSPCNHTFKWQDSKGVIHEYDCVLTDKTSPFASGINNGALISFADDQIMVVLPDDALTRGVSGGKRIIFNHDRDMVYKVTTVDRLTQSGILQLKLKHDTFMEGRDRPDLSLADYVPVEESEEPSDPSNPNPSEVEIVLTGSTRVNAIKPTVIESSVLVNKVETSMAVEFELDNTLAYIISQDGKQCKIEANQNWNFGEVVLTARLKDKPLIQKQITISVVSL